jgi:hypothetical protein
MRKKIFVNNERNTAKKYKYRQKVTKPVCSKCDLVCNPLFPPTKFRLSGWQCPGCLRVSKATVEERNLTIKDVHDYD